MRIGTSTGCAPKASRTVTVLTGHNECGACRRAGGQIPPPWRCRRRLGRHAGQDTDLLCAEVPDDGTGVVGEAAIQVAVPAVVDATRHRAVHRGRRELGSPCRPCRARWVLRFRDSPATRRQWLSSTEPISPARLPASHFRWVKGQVGKFSRSMKSIRGHYGASTIAYKATHHV